MSHIFEALQKSESDRRGGSIPASRRVTELLERVEAQVTSQWRSPEGPDAETAGPAEARFAAEVRPLLPQARDGAVPIDTPAPLPDGIQELTPEIFANRRLSILADRESPAAEAFRLLAVRLRHLRRDRKFRRVLITSTIPQEGKSLISANVACALALRARQRVLLIDGDLRRPSLDQIFGIGAVHGLAEYLRGDVDLTQALYTLTGANLWIMPAGNAADGTLELLQSSRLPALIERLSAWFDWVIIDSPPVLPLADTSVWARLAEGILLVTRQGTTQKRHLTRGLDALEPGKLLGAILNGASSFDDTSYYYYRRPQSAPDIEKGAAD